MSLPFALTEGAQSALGSGNAVTSYSVAEFPGTGLTVLVLGLQDGNVALGVPQAASAPATTSELFLSPKRFKVARGAVKRIVTSSDLNNDGSIVTMSHAPYVVAFDLWDAVAASTSGSSGSAAKDMNWRDKLIAKKKMQRAAKRLSAEDAAQTAQLREHVTANQHADSDKSVRLIECHSHFLPVTDVAIGPCDGAVAVWTSSLDGTVRSFRRSTGALLRTITMGFPVTCFAFSRLRCDAPSTAVVYFHDRIVVGGVGVVAVVDRFAAARPAREASSVEATDADGLPLPTIARLSLPQRDGDDENASLLSKACVKRVELDVGRAMVTAQFAVEGEAQAVEWLIAGSAALAVPTLVADAALALDTTNSSAPSLQLSVGASSSLAWPPKDLVVTSGAEGGGTVDDAIAMFEAAAEVDEELEALRAEHAKLQALCGELMQRVKAARSEVAAAA